MIAFFLSPIYILLNIYLLLRIMGWLGACHHICKHPAVKIIFTIIYAFLATSLLTGFLMPEGSLRHALKAIGNYWLGVLLYLSLTILVADLIRILLNRNKSFQENPYFHSRKCFAAVGTLCAVIIASISTGTCKCTNHPYNSL